MKNRLLDDLHFNSFPIHSFPYRKKRVGTSGNGLIYPSPSRTRSLVVGNESGTSGNEWERVDGFLPPLETPQPPHTAPATCLTCWHCWPRFKAAARCENPRAAGLRSPWLPLDFVKQRQHCPGFKPDTRPNTES
jgi:hypothetical protein